MAHTPCRRRDSGSPDPARKPKRTPSFVCELPLRVSPGDARPCYRGDFVNRWQEDPVEWLGMSLQALIDWRDPVVAHALSCRVKYVRPLRQKTGGQDRFWAQLVCEGKPFPKPHRGVGQGEVGLDIGPSTIAVVGEGGALLESLCEEVVRQHGPIRRLARKLDHGQRAKDPDNYLPDGRVRPGPKRWVKLGCQRETEEELHDLLRREAAHRKGLHGRMAGRVLAMGRTVKIEKASYRAWQRQYRRSVSVRAPGTIPCRDGLRPYNPRIANAEALDVVARLQGRGESRGEVGELSLRTPRLPATAWGG